MQCRGNNSLYRTNLYWWFHDEITCEIYKNSKLFDETESESISNSEEGDVHAMVISQHFVDLPGVHSAGALISLVYHLPAPEGVVHGYNAPSPQEHLKLLEIALVVDFIRVEEGEVEGASLALIDELLQRVGRRGDVQVDLVAHSSLAPEALPCRRRDRIFSYK